MIGDAVGDPAHAVLADAEAQVPARLGGGEVRLALDVGQVGFGQVGGPPEQLGESRGQRLDGVLAGVPRRDLGARLVGREVGVPAVGEPEPLGPAAELARRRRRRRRGTRSSAPPSPPTRASPAGDRLAEPVARRIGDVEALVRIPAVGLLGQADLVGPERRAVRLLAVLLVRAAVADVGPDRDEARAIVGQGGLDRRLDGDEVVAVPDPLGVPAVGIEALRDVLRERHRRRPVELDAVVVVEDDELAETQVAGQAGRLGGDPLLEVAVGGDDVGPVIDDLVAGAVELVRQASLGDGHADRVGEALAERAGRRLDAGRQPVFGVARRDAAPLAERLEVLERDLVAGQVEERVEQHAGVAGAQHEPVAVGPVRVRRRVAQEPRPQHVGHRRGAHRGARMPGIRLLDAIDRERPDRVDGQLVEVGGDGHRAGSDRSGWAGGGPRLGHCSRRPGYPPAMPPIRPAADGRLPRRPSRPSPGRRAGRAASADRRARRPDARCRARPGARARIGTDVPGRVSLVQGGSAATTARWLGRLGRALDA